MTSVGSYFYDLFNKASVNSSTSHTPGIHDVFVPLFTLSVPGIGHYNTPENLTAW